MVTRKNVKDKTAYVSNVTPSGLGIHYTKPLKGARATHNLTLRSGHSTIKLSGSQIRAVARVIDMATKMTR